MDTRLLAFIVWGIGMVLVYGYVMLVRLRSWRLHHDSRSARDLAEAAGLFVVAAASAAWVFIALFENTAGARGILGSLAAGALLAVGLIMATTPTKKDPAE